MKTANKETTTTTKANGTESLVGIAKIVLTYRGATKPNLAEIARIVGKASSLLKIADTDERSDTENKATMLLARELGLVT